MSATYPQTTSAISADTLESLRNRNLLSLQQMKLQIMKERIRCDRYGQRFGLIITQIHCNKSEYKKRLAKFAQILQQRLRITDECGLLDGGLVAILLPMTDYKGTRNVLSSITNLAAAEGIFFRAKVVVYPAINVAAVEMVSDKDDSLGPTDAKETDSILDQVVSGDSSFSFPEIPVSCQAVTHGTIHEYASQRYPSWKRACDVIGASIGLILTAPIVVAAAVAIRCTSEGPIFFLQARTGQFGRKFHILKLRTMVKNAEELKSALQESNERDGPAFKMKADPRVTKVGSFLRRTGIDELPQLINVLKGEMAIVGPRPLPCDEDADCELWQRRRLDTKPGLTCDWQISKSRKIPFVEWMRMDLRYCDRRSFLGDVSLVIKTVASVFLGRVGH